MESGSGVTEQSSPTRYRHIPGGLDKAVKQAEERGLHDLFIVDADVHVMEPFGSFLKYLDEPWKSMLKEKDIPKFVDYDVTYGDQFLARTGLWTPQKVNRTLSGRIKRPLDVETYPKPQENPEEIVEIFARRMNEIGIKQSVVFPTAMLALGNDPRFDLEVALGNAYIDWMLEHFLGKYTEILTPVYAPANSPEKAAELIDRVGSEKGVAGVMITPGRPKLAGDEAYNAIYEAAQQKGLPVVFHGESSLGGPFGGFKNYLGIHALSFPLSVITAVTSLVLEGVPERFPNLKFAFAEGGLTWIPWLMYRLDSEYMMRRSEAPLLRKMPSEYIKDFYFTTQPLEHPQDSRGLEWVFRTFDAENHLLFASDFPHWDFDVPSIVYDLPFLSEVAKKKILGENAAKLFKIN